MFIGNVDLIHLEIEDLRKKKICSDHFSDNDYANKSKKLLKRTAVPALYEVVPFHVRPPNKFYYNKQHKVNDNNIPSTTNDIRHNSESPSTPKRTINNKKYHNSNSSPSHNSKYS